MPNIDDIDLSEPSEEKPLPELSPFYQRVADRYLKHGNKARAYREAGGTTQDKRNYRMLARQILNHPAVAAYLKMRQEELAEEAKYDAIRAMNEAAEAIRFARKTKNASAMVKAVELRSRLTGLLIDRTDIRQVGSFTINVKGIDDIPVAEAVVQQAALAPPQDDEEEDE